jgi:glutamine cyclotransferase
MSISSTGLYGASTIVNTDLFTDVETLKEEMVTLSTSYLQTTAEHHTYVYMYIYTHTYVYIYVHTHIHAYIHISDTGHYQGSQDYGSKRDWSICSAGQDPVGARPAQDSFRSLFSISVLCIRTCNEV